MAVRQALALHSSNGSLHARADICPDMQHHYIYYIISQRNYVVRVWEGVRLGATSTTPARERGPQDPVKSTTVVWCCMCPRHSGCHLCRSDENVQRCAGSPCVYEPCVRLVMGCGNNSRPRPHTRR